MMHLMVLFILLLSSPAFAKPCTGCHQSPPRDNAHRMHSSLKTMNHVYGDTGSTQRYASFSTAYGFNCGNCHPSDRKRHRNGTVDILLLEQQAGNLKARNDPQARYEADKKTCTGVYCHSSGGNREILFVESPGWNVKAEGTDRCQSCHGSPPSYPGTPARPNGHFNITRGTGHLLAIHWDSVGGHTPESFKLKTATQMGCSTCHYNTVRKDRDTTFTDRTGGFFTCSKCHEKGNGEIFNCAVHVNGKVDIAFPSLKVRSKAQLSATPRGWKRIGIRKSVGSYDEAKESLKKISYDPKDQSCVNVSCHLAAGKVLWSQNIECSDCHGDLKATP